MDFAAPQSLVPSGSHVFTALHGSDKGMVAEFYMEAVEQPFLSEQEGRPIYKQVPYIRLFAPGSKSDIVRPVRLTEGGGVPPDNMRFPAQWAAFQSQQEQPQDGTPLAQWPMINKAQMLELKAGRIHTVEQLSAIPDSALQTIGMGARSLRDKALAWLSQAGDGAEVSKLIAENASLKADLDMMKQQIADLAAAQSKRGPGRPRKDGTDSNDD